MLLFAFVDIISHTTYFIAGDDSTVKLAKLKPLQKPFLRTSGKLKVEHLQKYLMKKLDLTNKKEIEISCKGATLGPELSLHFILRTRWFDTDTDLVLHYKKVDNWM